MNQFKYIVHKSKLIEQLNKYQKQFGVYFPVKSNNCREVIEILTDSESNFEVEAISLAEKLINEFNVAPNRILFCPMYDFKNQAETAIRMGIKFFVVSSALDAQILKEARADIRFLIRICSDQIIDNNPIFRPFGAQIGDVDKIVSNFNEGFKGFSFYISQKTRALFTPDIAAVFKKLYFKCRFDILNIGGGFIPEEAMAFKKSLREFFQGEILIEPGRHLLDPCIDIEADILQKAQKSGTNYLILNVGIYNGLIDAIIKNKRFEIVSPKPSVGRTKYIILGPTADTLDRLGEYELPDDLQVGDKLLIHNCGAYCETLSTDFSGYNNYTISLQ